MSNGFKQPEVFITTYTIVFFSPRTQRNNLLLSKLFLCGVAHSLSSVNCLKWHDLSSPFYKVNQTNLWYFLPEWSQGLQSNEVIPEDKLQIWLFYIKFNYLIAFITKDFSWDLQRDVLSSWKTHTAAIMKTIMITVTKRTHSIGWIAPCRMRTRSFNQ